MRWGIRAIVGGSFGEPSFGNRVMLGIPCLVATQADLEWLQKAITRDPREPRPWAVASSGAGVHPDRVTSNGELAGA